MQRITITIEDELLEEIDAFIRERHYQNRSEAIRDLARSGLAQARPAERDRRVGIAAVMYVYDHHKRDLSQRLTAAFHAKHQLSLAALHVHLDHDNCLEVTVLKGPLRELHATGERIIAERGVRHGRVYTLPATEAGHPGRGPGQPQRCGVATPGAASSPAPAGRWRARGRA